MTKAILRTIAALVVLVLACSLASAQAVITLSDASATYVQTSDAAWSLTKTGVKDPTSSTITWTITATKTSTKAGQLIVNGFMEVSNTGNKGATIGNIVVNLQGKKPAAQWATLSSDVNDATKGDAATTAAVDPHASSEDKSSFTENSASGKLLFMDANNNTTFSLVPEVTIAPGATVNLLFQAWFDNTVLLLAKGEAVRTEVIVSFGNANDTPKSASRVDINGNGTIDADEAWIRSVPARLGGTVPAETAVNASPTLTDTAANIATTGTATYSNAQFNLSPTGGTVTVTYAGGTSGGNITNCANLNGAGSSTKIGGFTFLNIAGLNLQACDTQTIASATCAPGTVGCGWKTGDMLTYTQLGWVATVPGSTLLSNDFDLVYASTFGVLEVGLPSPGFSIEFSGGGSLAKYLPASGTPGPLTSNLFEPITSSSGVFGGDVVALELDVDFADVGVLMGTSGLKFGNLSLCNITDLTSLNGMTVREVLATANTMLGGGSGAYTFDQIDGVIQSLTDAFGGGAPSSFAQAHLVNGTCP